MDPEIDALRAVAHPLRLQILSLLTGVALSAAEVARELDVTHANASYHLRLLLDAGELVVESEEKIRGGTAKRYRHVWDAPPQGRKAGEGSAEAYVRAMAAELVRRHEHRLAGAGETCLADAEVWVEPQVWAEALAAVRTASALVHANARAPRAEGAVRVNLSVAAFRMQP